MVCDAHLRLLCDVGKTTTFLVNAALVASRGAGEGGMAGTLPPLVCLKESNGSGGAFS